CLPATGRWRSFRAGCPGRSAGGTASHSRSPAGLRGGGEAACASARQGSGGSADDTLPAPGIDRKREARVARTRGVQTPLPGAGFAHGGMSMSQDLRKVGLKVTRPRLRILELLEHAKPRHMTAEDIYMQLLAEGEEIGLATIYR